ncbi:hypothetical protein [Floccifex sp.]|uniref:hypothetical protein n=1 Tax=Floccifex sp. TaxID=2815810 RepID=UPI003EFF0F71
MKEVWFKGQFGLEKESLRITKNGFLSMREDPFLQCQYIVKDFCECQTEINTCVCSSAKEAIEALYEQTKYIQNTLAKLDEPELLWPFSNPPYIRSEKDIQIAQFSDSSKEEYRQYLSNRYGRYKMALCGIHVNYSFSEDFIQQKWKESNQNDYETFKNQFYLHVTQLAAKYGWLITMLTAASPLLDSSYSEKGVYGKTRFNGMASTRCSDLGYWNQFSPYFDYSSIDDYANSIQKYVDTGLIVAPSELYYPIRLKPKGMNSISSLRINGANHIELRMIDCNPLVKEGLDIRDLEFIELFLIWLSEQKFDKMDVNEQIQAVQNFKNAAHYDLKTIKIKIKGQDSISGVKAGLKIIDQMEDFFKDCFDKQKILTFEKEKLEYPEKRYAWILRKELEEDFVGKGLQWAIQQQKEAI